MRKKLQDNYKMEPIQQLGMPCIRVTCKICGEFSDTKSASKAKVWMSSHKKLHKEKPSKVKPVESGLEDLLEKFSAAARKAQSSKNLQDRFKVKELGIQIFLFTSPKKQGSIPPKGEVSLL